MNKTDFHLKGVDLYKFIMAMGVVAIHIASADCTYGYWSAGIEWFIRLAVPFFFISSGYLIAIKMPVEAVEKEKYLRKRTKKVLKLFVYWIIIYLPVSIYFYARNGYSILYDISRYIGQLLVLGESKYAYPLWYLYSLSIVLFIYSVAVRWKNVENKLWVLYASIIFINWISASDIIGSDIGAKILSILSLCTSRTLGGGVYVMTGVILAKTNFSHKRMLCIASICGSVVLFYCNLPFWELCGGLALFLSACEISSISSRIANRLRVLSMWIYYLHMYVIVIMIYICRQLSCCMDIYFAYVTALTVVVLISLILTYLQTRRGCGWLNRLVA